MRRSAGAVAAFVVALAWAAIARAQVVLPTRGPAATPTPQRAFLPYLRRDATATPRPTPTVGPHCRVVASNDFENGLQGWTFSDGGDQTIKRTDRVLDPFGPHVVELVTGEDGGSHLRSPAFAVPPIPGLRRRVDATYSYRNIRGRRTPTDDILATGFVRIPFRGIDEDSLVRDFDFNRSDTSKIWRSAGGTTDTFGDWLEWPEVQVRIVAAGDNSDTRWQIDGARVEVCYVR